MDIVENRVFLESAHRDAEHGVRVVPLIEGVVGRLLAERREQVEQLQAEGGLRRPGSGAVAGPRLIFQVGAFHDAIQIQVHPGDVRQVVPRRKQGDHRRRARLNELAVEKHPQSPRHLENRIVAHNRNQDLSRRRDSRNGFGAAFFAGLIWAGREAC